MVVCGSGALLVVHAFNKTDFPTVTSDVVDTGTFGEFMRF
jgi:hypothetical protein